MEQHFSIKVLSGIYSILKVKDRPGLPEIVNRTGNSFFSLIRLKGEWTIICESGGMPDDSLVVESSHGWRVFLIDEPLTFDMIGVIYRITEILKDAGISVMAIYAITNDVFFVI
ncbi:MAG: ACT domain-containing protein [Gemmatimonadetes bacterium]|nr:ACT domain-containing protein [Gemmatimonadota bacterium]